MASDVCVLMEFNSLPGLEIHAYGKSCGFSSVSIDSRSCGEGALFVALPGLSNDGHSFVEAAFKNGAAAALVEQNKLDRYKLDSIAKNLGKTLIIADNTLKALHDTARAYLEKFPGLLKIAITGSAGKTTTKEITAAIIGAEKNVVKNPGNYNSETGLPLAVFEIRSCHEVGIFEMGMNKPGEIAALASVLKPNIALITNIGSAHIGILGSIEAIAEEKKQIFSRLDENGIALIPGGCAFGDFLQEGVRGKVVFYDEQSAGLEGIQNLGLDGSDIILDGQPVRFPLPGRHNTVNALAAIAIAREVPVSSRAIRQGLESVQPMFGRTEIIRGRATVIQDCYNASPESLTQAIEFCENLDWPGRRVYVIGDMLEQGNNSRQAHSDIGRLVTGADMVFLYGRETMAATGALEGTQFFHTCDIDELSSTLDAYVQDGDLVLVKGSRGCALERVCAVLANPVPPQAMGGSASTGGSASIGGE